MTSPETDAKTAASPDSSEAPSGGLSAAERKAILKRTALELTREARATIRKKGEFEATLVRGKRVNHLRHLITLIALGALTALTLTYWTNYWYIVAASSATLVYGLGWLFLAVTSGEQLDRISVDEAGRITSVKSGVDPGKRGDYERVLVPVLAIACSAWIVFGLTRDIVVPPHPACPGVADTDPCWELPNLGVDNNHAGGVGKGSTITATPAIPGVTASPGASASAGASSSPAAGATDAPGVATLNVAQTKIVERMVRVFQLAIALGVLLGSIWVLRRLLTGRWVLSVGPVGHRKGDD